MHSASPLDFGELPLSMLPGEGAGTDGESRVRPQESSMGFWVNA